MEGWSRQANRDRDVLMRIVALMVAMAGLAERAANLSGRRRRYLLQILWYAEAEGRDLIVGLIPAPTIEFDEPDLADDAARLAASFRVLALVLYAMLTARVAFPGARDWRAVAQRPTGPAVRRLDVLAPNTS